MSTKRTGLGRNLSALLGQQANSVATASPDTKAVWQHCPILQLQPGKYQPRGDFDDEALSELANSIQSQGLIQPLVVREIGNGRYEIIAGERRWRACQQIGLKEVPVLVRQVDDETAMALALVENLQREELNIMDQARAMQRLIEEFGLTHEQIATILSKSRTTISNALRLLNLVPEVRRMLEHGDLDMGHARCLLALDPSAQEQAARLVVARGLSVRETETLVARVKNGKEAKVHCPPDESPFWKSLSEEVDALSIKFKTRIQLKQGKAGKGVLMIHYPNEQSLQAMLSRMKVSEDV